MTDPLTGAATWPADGFVLVDKPQAMTSQRAVTQVKKALGVRKAGHAGTLDAMATGLLIVAVSRATRLLGYLSGKDKQYEATIRLGQATTTDDADGELLGEVIDATGLTDEAIGSAMRRYLGDIEQVPSTVSAIKVDGRRAYARARAGEEVVLASRPVTVTRFEVIQRHNSAPWLDLDVVVECSTGTYVRALARDLGRDLGVGGHLTQLRRTKIGDLNVRDAVLLEDVGAADLIDMVDMARHIAPLVEVDDDLARQISVGRALDLALPADLAGLVAGERLVALYRRDPEDSTRACPVIVLTGPVGVHDDHLMPNHSHDLTLESSRTQPLPEDSTTGLVRRPFADGISEEGQE